MKFLTLVKGSENAGQPPMELYAAVEQLGRELVKAGVMVGQGGLMPSGAGARARVAKQRITVTDGPFTEAKEVIGGYAIYHVQSKAEMMELVRRFCQVSLDHWPEWEGEVEVRQLYDGSDQLEGDAATA